MRIRKTVASAKQTEVSVMPASAPKILTTSAAACATIKPATTFSARDFFSPDAANGAIPPSMKNAMNSPAIARETSAGCGMAENFS